MLNKLSIIAFVLLIVVACSEEQDYQIKVKNGAKIVTNKYQREIKDYQFKQQFLEQDLTKYGLAIDAHPSFSYNKGNFYFFSLHDDFFVISYDKNFKKAKKLLGKGSGPGESKHVFEYFVADSLVYFYGLERVVGVLDLAGNYLRQIKVDRKKLLIKIYGKIGENFLVSYIENYANRDNKGINYSLEIVDQNFNSLKVLLSESSKNRYLLPRFHAAISGNEIFAAAAFEKKKYQIKNFDLNGNLKTIIIKKTKEIQFSEREKKQLEKELNGKLKESKKRLIRSLFTDSQKRLWVGVTEENDTDNFCYYDLFENGIYQMTYKLPYHTASLIKDGYFFIYSMEDNHFKGYKL